MNMRKLAVVFCILGIYLCTGTPAALSQEEQGGKRTPLQIEGKSALPLRVLARAFSSIYKQPDKAGGTVEDNVPAFQSFFVYDRKGSNSDLDPLGWYEVGTDNRGTVVGWMHSDDVFEWKQTMCLSYTHPEGRNPVLMFDKKESLEKITAMPDEQRSVEVEKLYRAIDAGNIAADFPVLTVEPKMAVDIAKEFYLLPILDFAQIELNNREARILQLAAVTKGDKARESSDIRVNKDFLESATLESNEISAQTLEKLKIDIVWVMDTTNSMMPYITHTLKVVEDASKRISADPQLAEAVHFGVWGYRDAMEIPGIGYNTRNYTPELQMIEQFASTLKTVDVTTSGSQGYAEDVFSGVNGAVDETAWTPDAIKLVILVGDAPSHEVGHKWNASGQSQDTLRAIANDRGISIFALHIKDPQAEKYHETAIEQFLALSTNPGAGEVSSYFAVAADDLPGFEKATKEVTDVVIGLIENAREAVAGKPAGQAAGEMAAAAPETAPGAVAAAPARAAGPINLDLFDEPAAAAEEAQPSAAALAKSAMKAALVEWIGSQTGAQAPKDVVAWVTDKDLIQTDIQALEVRLLVNKRQLDSLRETLNTILLAGRQGQISGEDFFSSLQAAAATTARDPEMIKQSRSLAQTGLIPEFLVGLPYTSRIMDMNNELWNSWSVDEQDMFLADLEARIMAYETIHDSPEGWVQLNRNDDPDEFVYPITLELLP